MPGRPTTITPEVRKKFVAALKRGNFRETAAQHAGVNLRAVQRYLAKKDDPEVEAFRRECDEADTGVEMALMGGQFKAAIEGDLQTGRWILSIRKPHLFGQQRELLREVRRVIAKLEKERANLRREVARLHRTKSGPVDTPST